MSSLTAPLFFTGNTVVVAIHLCIGTVFEKPERFFTRAHPGTIFRLLTIASMIHSKTAKFAVGVMTQSANDCQDDDLFHGLFHFQFNGCFKGAL
jgi:hypothetical protein